MKRLHLNNVASESRDVKDQLITLACGHTFTVQTLDRHCGLRKYYDVDTMGRFLAPKTPSATVPSEMPPTCPTCRGPVTALRYGRITKRAAMDILEQNFARLMSAAVDRLSPSVSSHMSKLSTYQEQARSIEANIVKENTLPHQSVSFTDSGPLPGTAFDLVGMQSAHRLAPEEARAWQRVVQDIVNTYQRVLKLANARGPHIKMYEAALSTLLRIEMRDKDRVRANEASDPRVTRAIVDRKIGQPRPQVDVPSQVEAYFLSLELRSLLAKIAQSRVEGLSKTSNDPDIARHRGLWTNFVSFLFDSCVADAEKAAVLAKGCPTPTPRQATRAAVLKLQFAFDGFRWKLVCEHAELSRTGALDWTARARLGRKATDYKYGLRQSFKEVEEAHHPPPPQAVDGSEEERQWLAKNCRAKAEALEQECARLAEMFVDRVGVDRRVSVRELETTAVKRQPTSSSSSGCIVT